MPFNRLQAQPIHDADFIDLEWGPGNDSSNLRQRTIRNLGGSSTVAGQASGFIGIDRLAQAREMRQPSSRSTVKVVAELAAYLAASSLVLSSFVPIFNACLMREENIYPVAIATLAYKYLQPERFNAMLENRVLPLLLGARIMRVVNYQGSRAKLTFFVFALALVSTHALHAENERNPEEGLMNRMDELLGEEGILSTTVSWGISTSNAFEIEHWLLQNLVQLLDRFFGQPERPDTESVQIIRDVENARPLQEVVLDWTRAIPAAQRGQLKDELWRDYSTHEGGPVFSSFLDKLYSGFPRYNRAIRGIQSSQGFARDRLLPILLAMQSDAEFAHRVFAMADAGLGACTDRPPLTLIDMELEAKIHGALQVLGSSKVETNAHTEASTVANSPVREVLKYEFQKLNKQRAINLLRNQIRMLQNENRLLGMEVIEDVMAAYQAIQLERPEFFPNLPYRKFGSSLDSGQIDQLSANVQNELTSLWSAPCPAEAVQHLLASDSWQVVLQVLTGKNTAQLREQFLSQIDVRLEQLTDQASEEEISEAEYSRALLDLQAERRQGLADIYSTPEFVNLTHRLIENAALSLPS